MLVWLKLTCPKASTGAGFTFSSVFNYDGMVFYGHPTFVKCADEFKRYNECFSLSICVTAGSTHYDFLSQAFPIDNIVVGANLEEIAKMLFNGTCSTMSYEKSAILRIISSEDVSGKNYTIGSKMLSKEPEAMVTRKGDPEFSDTVNWVLQALIYGEEHGLKKDPTLCQNSTGLALAKASDMDFMNAVYCVGNYAEIYDCDLNSRGMNQINNGTGGLLYAIPFGDLEKESDIALASTTIATIRNNGRLNCGVIVPDGFSGNVTSSTGFTGMGVDYCRALAASLAAALFSGDFESANLIGYEESSRNVSHVALANGDIDVLVGARKQKKYDFLQSPSLPGVRFSTPYYYDQDDATNVESFFAMATREDDSLFASFVDTIVLATIYAQENNIDRETSIEMPLAFVFGSDFSWALRDAIFYSGSYDGIYAKNFGGNEESSAKRDRNALNEGGPMLLSIPGLAH